VTLPFVSHGGSSLLISYFELLCLILISAQPERTLEFQPDKGKKQIRLNFLLSAGMILCLVGLTLVVGWWGFVRGPDLLTRTDNPRRAIDDLFVKRGAILDRQGQPLAESTGQPGSYQRIYSYPALSPILGYTHPIYGQSGLETGLDAHLRGLKGYPGLSLWWEHLLYGQLPPGLDVRLSLDRDLQSFADELLGGSPGAVTLLNADSGEILAMASSPSFDSNHLDTEWENLINDPSSPLYDRAGMGLYPPGSILGAFLLAATDQVGSDVFQGSGLEECALAPTTSSWQAVISAGCIEPLNQLSQRLNENELITLLDRLGLFAAPALPIETLSIAKPESNAGTLNYLTGSGDSAAGAELKVSPLQMALTAAALSHEGIRPPPLLAIAVNTPQAGWVMLPNESGSMTVFPAEQANKTASSLADQELPIWYAVSEVHENEGAPEDAKPGYSWFIGGTLPEWTGAPLSIAVLLEEKDSPRVLEMGKALLQKAMQP
jgi:peptidoglycan glycosyltransferase